MNSQLFIDAHPGHGSQEKYRGNKEAMWNAGFANRMCAQYG
jgi:hypothetical protein